MSTLIDPMILTFIILIVTIAIFISDKFRMDVVSILAMLALYLTGLVSSQQALAGFASSTVVMITGLFVVGAGLFRTGVAAWISHKLIQFAGTNEVKLFLTLMIGTGLLSGFLSNTGTVAVLLPAVVAASWQVKSTPSKLLLPLAVGANVGGLLTLIGTPPNIVVSDALAEAGYEPMGFFEFGLIGFPLLLVAVGYMLIMGRTMLPEYKSKRGRKQPAASPKELAQSYHLTEDLHQVQVKPNSELVGKNLAQSAIGHNYNISVLFISRAPTDEALHDKPLLAMAERFKQSLQEDDDEVSEATPWPEASTTIQANDLLLLKGEEDAVQQLAAATDLKLLQTDVEAVQARLPLVEVLLVPRSSLIGDTLRKAHFAAKYGVQVVGVMRRNQPLEEYLDARLEFGDALLVHATRQQIKVLQNEPRNFVVVGQPSAERTEEGLRPRAFVAIFAMFGMMGMMMTDYISSPMAVLIAALFMVITGCLNMEQAYKAINWESVIMIAAMIPMSTALEQTGGAAFIANGLVNTLGGNSLLLLAGVFLITVTFTQVISNTATSILIAPIAISTAQDLGLSPYPILMMVAVGASTAFVTPIASPVNMLVLNPGSYKFADFVKIGLPLVAIFMLIAVVLVPLIWPL